MGSTDPGRLVMHTSASARHRSARVPLIIALALVLGGGVTATASAQSNEMSPALDSVRASLARYEDPIQAVHDGYLSTVGCIAFPKGETADHSAHESGAMADMAYKPGAMGVHFLNPNLISATPDPTKPNVLLYEPVGDKLRLVGAEWFVPLATGVKERPTLFGHPFDGPMEGHQPIMPAGLTHYDLHVWLFKNNPYGMFVATNPDVKCGKYAYTTNEGAPKIVKTAEAPER
jgi:hypothetical protein